MRELPEIVYVKGVDSQYIASENIILIDENLKNYPLAFEEILSHEMLHYYYKDSFIYTLKLELNSDIRQFSKSDKYVCEIEEYINDKKSEGSIKFGVVNLIRHIYLIPLQHTYILHNFVVKYWRVILAFVLPILMITYV